MKCENCKAEYYIVSYSNENGRPNYCPFCNHSDEEEHKVSIVEITE